jgi:peptidoglycan hydrolase-like protein with peptidoglycan-binding domain
VIGRRTLVIAVVAAVVLSVATTWLATRLVRSPAEVAARTAPPPPTTILAPVESRELATKVISRGTGHYGSPVNVSLAGSYLKRGPQLVTSLPSAGTALKEGDVALTVSGRPAFLLQGAQPSFRDLGPGMTGTDVKQLKSALKRLGYDPGPQDGAYDAATERAVESLYAKSGYSPLKATNDDVRGLLPVEARLIAGAMPGGGVQLPASEVLFMRAAPVRVDKLVGHVGESANGALLSVTDSAVSVDAQLPVDQATLVRPDAVVTIDEPDLGIKTTGKVTEVAANPGTNGVDNFHVFFRVAVAQAPDRLVGTSVRLTIAVDQSSKSQLTVPLSAVSTAADGSARVQKSAGGKVAPVPVNPGLAADGYVAIDVPGGGLAAGDQVVIGTDKGASAARG